MADSADGRSGDRTHREINYRRLVERVPAGFIAKTRTGPMEPDPGEATPAGDDDQP